MLNVTALGADLQERPKVSVCCREMISFEGMQMRSDIAEGARRWVTYPRSRHRCAEAEVRAQLEELDVDAPRVGIVMGSESDMETMEKAADELEERGILHELRVMSAHREPDVVADYAKNARVRGLRVIIAGAGISAALPGAVAAHTDLPVIGVPLSGRLTAAGGLDAILSIVQMPPGVPVACVGLDNPRNAAILAAQILRSMIARYTRPELGACGPTRRAWRPGARSRSPPARSCPACSARRAHASELEAIRAATFTVEAVDERERITDHDVAAFVDVLAASAGEAGRWIHFGLTSSDVLDTALALQLRDAGEVIVRRAPASSSRRSPRARASTSTRCASGAPTACTPSPRPSASSSPGFAFEAHRNARAPGARLRAGCASARSRARSAPTRPPAPSSRRACSRGSGLAREDVSTQVVARDRHAELLQAIALAGAGLERFATEVRHLQRTEVREAQEPFRAGQKGSSAMPHKRNPIKSRADLRPRARAARQRPGRRWRTSRCGTSATSRTPRSSA